MATAPNRETELAIAAKREAELAAATGRPDVARRAEARCLAHTALAIATSIDHGVERLLAEAVLRLAHEPEGEPA